MDATHRNIFEQLMKSEAPAMMFKEFREGGAKFISEYLLNIADDYILRRLKDISGLKDINKPHVLNPNLSEDELGITGIKIEIEKAKQIKSIIENKRHKTENPLETTVTYITELLNKEEREYLPIFQKLQTEVQELKTITEKITFWKNEKTKYLLTISNATFASSGVINYYIPDKELFMDRLITQEIERLEKISPTHAETKTKQETPTFTNNFDKIPPTVIYNHFKAGLVEKGYLTEQELNEYLKAAFEQKAIPHSLFKIKDAPNKASIEAVFYTYYKNVAGKIHGKQNQYAALLGDYFEGYKTATVSSNFSKSVY